MSNYLYDEATTIKDKDGNPVKVSIFRKRESYPASLLGVAVVRNDEDIRVDLLSDRLVGGIFNLDRIIDCNDKDVLSFVTGEKIKYARQ